MGRLILFCILVFTAFPARGSVVELRQQGLDYRAQNRWEEAIAAFEQAVRAAPQEPQGYVLLGWTQHLAQRRSEAARSLTRALWLNPFGVEAANALGIVYLVEGALPPSILVHTWAALLRPGNEIAHYNLSLAFQRQDLGDWALVHAQRAIALEPSNPHPLVALAVIYWAEGDRPAAIETYAAAVSLDDRYSNADFLNHLPAAGFHAQQVEIALAILGSI